jgi:dihydrofolate reductase
MRKIIYSTFITLDGVIEDPGGADKSKYGGWAFQFERGPEGDKFKMDEMLAAGALLLGRVTFDGFAAAWPSRTGEFADRMNGLPKYVVSNTLKDPTWQNTTVLTGDIPREVKKLKALPGGDILVTASSQLLPVLVENDLVDELRLMVYPVIVGGGKHLLRGESERARFQLVQAKPVGDGVIILIYQPERK